MRVKKSYKMKWDKYKTREIRTIEKDKLIIKNYRNIII